MTRTPLPRSPRLRIFLALLLACLACLAATALAQDRRALVETLDARAAELLREHDVAGAAVALVMDGEIVHAAGYGHADADADREATADTPFSLGSVGKLMTWTLLMQLVEEGRVDLDDPVADHVDVPVPGPEDGVRVRHLLAHTAGFDDRWIIGLIPDASTDLRPLRDTLLASTPTHRRPPGEVISYDNWGTSLAGYLVERATGLPYERAVEERVLEPLGMARSTARQPPPAAMAAAEAHRQTRNGPEVSPYELVPLAPAGAIAASANDLARFALAYLGDGALPEALGGGRILEGETVRRMREPLHVNAGGSGNAHGWWTRELYGLRVFQHEGDSVAFHAGLYLVPDRDAALVILTNSPAGTFFRVELSEAFLRGLSEAPPIEPVVAEGVDLDVYTGTWTSNRISHGTSAKLLTTVSGLFPVGRDGDALTLPGIAGEPYRFLPVSETLFVQPGTGRHLAFELEDGRPYRMFISDAPVFALDAVPWWGTPFPFLAVLALTALLSLGALTLWPWRARRARRRGGPIANAIALRTTSRLVAGLALALLLALGATALDATDLLYGLNVSFGAALAIATLFPLATAASLVATTHALRTGRGGREDRIWAGALAASAVLLSVLLVQWNLVGVRL